MEATEMCAMCGGPATLVEEPHTLNMAGRLVTYDDRFYRCGRCGETYYTGTMTAESSRRAAAVIRAEDGLLGPDDIVTLRKKYGLSQAGLERLIGAGEKTVVRWERGTVAQNRTADTLLRVLADHPDVVARLARERGVRLRNAAARPRRAKRVRRPATEPRPPGLAGWSGARVRRGAWSKRLRPWRPAASARDDGFEISARRRSPRPMGNDGG
jgi:HTH-type transcriptional regulator/antitoxin MqsA